MKLVSWNVNGIRAVIRKGAFMPMIAELRPDILCLQETKAQQGQAEVDLPEYEEFWNSAERKGYSGTALFSKEKPKAVMFGFPDDINEKFSLSDEFGDSATEGRVMAAEFEEYFVVNVYTPNTKRDLSRLGMRYEHWDPAFLTYIKQLNKKKPVIFCGDLNVAHTQHDLANPKQNEGEHGFTKEEREGADKMIQSGFTDTFRMFNEGNGYYTWWSPFQKSRDRNVGWRLDYVFVSEELKGRVKGADIHPDITGSDHCPVSIELT